MMMDLTAIDRSATRDDGWLRSLDPKVKLAAMAVTLALVISSDSAVIPGIVAAGLITAALTSRVDIRLALTLALYPTLFALIFAFSSALGVEATLGMVLRAVVSALAAVIVVLTTPYPEVFAPIQRVTPAIVGDALLLTYRSLFILLDKFSALRRAVTLRSSGSRRGIRHTARTVAPALGGLVLYSLDLAQRSYDVMRVRGYSGRLRTGMRPTRHAPERTPDMNDSSAAVEPQAVHEDAVRVSCVRHAYEDGTTVHLCGLDFVARRGERTVLLGPNGSGKTTLLYHILGLLKSTEGSVRVLGADPAESWPNIARRVGVVLQNVDEQLLMPTVRDDIAFSPRQYGLGPDEVDRRVDTAMDLLGIRELGRRVPHSLSGGEKRKVALAGALVLEPDLLVLDEPFEGLDPASRRVIVELLERLAHERGMAVVMSTHDIDAVAELADYCYVLKTGGEIALKGTPAEVFARADDIAASNIRPPVLAELFLALRADDPSAPSPELTVEAAVESLSGWKRS